MWQKAAKISDIEEGKSQTVELSGKPIAIFKAQGNFYAIDNGCPHRGGPLGEGYLDGFELTCPWHAWVFNIKTGACQMDPEIKQKCFPVKVEGEDVMIDT